MIFEDHGRWAIADSYLAGTTTYRKSCLRLLIAATIFLSDERGVPLKLITILEGSLLADESIEGAVWRKMFCICRR